MEKKELAFAKQCALATKDWDVFQAILRKCLKDTGRQVGKRRAKA